MHVQWCRARQRKDATVAPLAWRDRVCVRARRTPPINMPTNHDTVCGALPPPLRHPSYYGGAGTACGELLRRMLRRLARALVNPRTMPPGAEPRGPPLAGTSPAWLASIAPAHSTVPRTTWSISGRLFGSASQHASTASTHIHTYTPRRWRREPERAWATRGHAYA
jgi:hypothetical protein